MMYTLRLVLRWAWRAGGYAEAVAPPQFDVIKKLSNYRPEVSDDSGTLSVVLPKRDQGCHQFALRTHL